MNAAPLALKRRATCRACGSRRLFKVFDLRPSPIGDEFVLPSQAAREQPCYPIDLHQCRDCGLNQLLDVVPPEILYPDYIYRTASSLGLREHFADYARDVAQKLGIAKGDLVIDIGSNDGTLLAAFGKRGARILGIEPAAEIARRASEAEIETVNAYFSPEIAGALRDSHGPARLITANNVFANVDDLDGWMRGVAALLATDGCFVFETFYLADLLANMVFDFIYHEHLTAFSVRPVAALCARHGLELFAVERVATKGGSIRCFVRRASGAPPPASVAALLAEEEASGLYREESFRGFRQRVDALADETRRHVDRVIARGGSVAAFGACITGTTLLYHFGLQDRIDFIADDNPDKQGRLSPGAHIPVLPGRSLLERKPDLTLVLAWRYADTIIGKYAAYLDQGGCFLIPAPTVRVLGAGEREGAR